MIRTVRKYRIIFGKYEQEVEMPTSEDYWLTRPEVGERLRVPEKTLAQWAHLGRGPKYARFGRHCRYRLSDVIAWENDQFSGDAA